MATVQGDIIQAMKACVRGGTRLAVLVIDEQGEGVIPLPYRTAQERVLRCARLLGMPIVFVELNPHAGEADNLATNSALRQAAAGAPTRVVTKTGFNAFVNTTLEAALTVMGVGALVAVGRETNQCVRNTVVGGAEGSRGDRYADGAVQRGYRVLCSDLIIRTGIAQWQQEYPADVLGFYTHVLDLSIASLKGPLPPVPRKPGTKPLPPIPRKPLPPIPGKKF